MIHLLKYTIILIIGLLINTIESLNVNIPLPNTLIFAGASSLVTWSINNPNITSTNLYLANGADTNNLVVFSIYGQNIPTSKTSMWVKIPTTAPNDNTFLVLEGNDTPASRVTVPLNIAFGSQSSSVSPVPTGPTPTPSANITSSSSSIQSTTTSSISSKTKSSSPSSSSSSSSPDTSSPSETPSSGSSSNTIIGAVIGSIVGIGLVAAVVLLCIRKQRNKKEKRHTELFDDKGIDFSGYHEDTYNNNNNNNISPQQQYYNQQQPYQQQQQPYQQQSPFNAPSEMYPMNQMNYSRSMNQTPLPLPQVLDYPTKTIDSTNMQDNGFQSRTQIESIPTNDSFISNNKPNEIDSQKPHSKY